MASSSALTRPTREISSDKERYDAFRSDICSILGAHGLGYFIVSYFPDADKAGLIENIVATNWPHELLAQYATTDIFRESKIVADLKKTILPICSGDLLFARARDGVRTELPRIFYDDGFANTIGISLYAVIRRHYLIMLSGQRKVTDQTGLGSLLLSVMKALDAFTPVEVQEEILGPRILDCLRWSAAGKSSEDIATILGLSTHTVNDYLKTAIKRLNAVTRTQAVAIACRLRLI